MKTKRFVSLLLTLTMLVSLMGMISLPVSAVVGGDTEGQKYQVPSLEVSGIPGAPVIGQRAKWGDAIVPEGAGYTAEYLWREPSEYYEYPETGEYGWGSGPFYGIFEEGKDYRLCVDICLLEDWIGWNYYEPGDDFQVTVNINGGEDSRVVDVYSGIDDGELFAYADFEMVYLGSKAIHTVEVFGAVEPVYGEIASEDGVYVSENAPYEILRTAWIDENYDCINGEVFGTGYYRLDLEISPAEGYHFADDCKFYANGVEFNEGTFEPWRMDPYIEPVYCAIEIDKVEISYEIAPPVVGEVPEDVVISVPEDANYHTYCFLYEYTSDGYYEVDTFLPGTEYIYEIVVFANEGYVFSEDVEILINGTDASELEDCHHNMSGIWIYEWFMTEGDPPGSEEPDESYAWLEISGVQEPVAGERATTEGISVSGSIPCTVEAVWYTLEYDTQNYEYIYTEFNGTFEVGKEYGLGLILTPLEGYSFPEEIRVDVIGCDYWWFYPESPDLLEISPYYFEYDLRRAIRSVEITGVTDAVIGQRATTEGIELVADGECTVSACWYQVDGEEYREFSGVFQDNNRYLLELVVTAGEGYVFDVYSALVNGEEFPAFTWQNNLGIELVYDFRDLIESVEIVGLQEPEVGQPASTEGVYIEGNLPCEMEISWYRSEYIESEYAGGGYYEYVPYEGVFETGYVYSIGFEITAADGYYFSDGCRVTLNGTEIYPYGGSDYLCLSCGEYTYQFGDIINRITLTLPGDGELMGEQVNTEGVWLSSNAPCTESITWYTQFNNGAYAPFTGTFGNGHYWLVAELTPAEGYHFSDCMVDLAFEYGMWYGNADYLKYQSGKLYAGFEFDYREEIEEVWLTSTDVAAIGAAATNDGISVPEGTNYTATAQWNTMELDLEAGESEFLPFEGNFRADEIYMYLVDILPAEGYRFSDYLTVWFNDQLVDDFMVGLEEFGAQNKLVWTQTFTGNLKPVEQIDVVINCTPGTSAVDAVELSAETEGCFIYRSMWYDADIFTGSFVNGDDYGIEMVILPEEGYYLSPDLELNIIVPGESYMHDTQIYAYGCHFLLGCLCREWSQSSDGDLTGDAVVDNEDVAYLLWYTLFPEDYPVSANVDFNGDGIVNNKDVEYLLWYTLFPEDYPI